MTNAEKERRLWSEITAKRNALSEAYAAHGNTDRVLALSQELDKLLNEYAKLRCKMKGK